MTQLPWHDYVDGETSADLFALTDTHRVDSLVVAFETALMKKRARVGLEALSEPERDVLAIEALERQVNNGGYNQFFSSDWYNEFAGPVVDALRRIGCVRTADICARALRALPVGTALDSASLTAAMEDEDPARDALLEECNRAYFESSENIADALFDYLKQHRASMQLP